MAAAVMGGAIGRGGSVTRPCREFPGVANVIPPAFGWSSVNTTPFLPPLPTGPLAHSPTSPFVIHHHEE